MIDSYERIAIRGLQSSCRPAGSVGTGAHLGSELAALCRCRSPKPLFRIEGEEPRVPILPSDLQATWKTTAKYHIFSGVQRSFVVERDPFFRRLPRKFAGVQ